MIQPINHSQSAGRGASRTLKFRMRAVTSTDTLRSMILTKRFANRTCRLLHDANSSHVRGLGFEPTHGVMLNPNQSRLRYDVVRNTYALRLSFDFDRRTEFRVGLC